VSSNAVTLSVSLVVVLVVPKVLGVEEYGYFQRYIFYSSYAYLLHFGWIDGVYLRVGGKSYSDLDERSVQAQFILLCSYQAIMSLAIASMTVVLGETTGAWVLPMIGLGALVVVPRTMLSQVMQATNLIFQYSRVLLVDRILYLALVLALLVSNTQRFEPFVLADLLAKSAGLVLAIYLSRSVIFVRQVKLRHQLSEVWTNIRIGSSVVFAFLASNLVIGVVRFGSDLKWGVVEFGKLSLLLSATTFLLTFFNSIGLTVYPLIRRVSVERSAKLYQSTGVVVVAVLSIFLGASYPLQWLGSVWLPEYLEAWIHFPLLFPLLLFEGRMAVLTVPYLKALRMERLMLQVNLTVVALSILVTWIVVFIVEEFALAVASITILVAVRSGISDYVITRATGTEFWATFTVASFAGATSAVLGWFVGGWRGAAIYLVLAASVLLLHRTRISRALSYIKEAAK